MRKLTTFLVSVGVLAAPAFGQFVTFIADSQNNVIRQVVGGGITTVAGTGAQGFAGDGGLATKALLHLPSGVAVDPNTGDVYIADTLNNRVRKVHLGVITTVAGNGAPSYSGDGGPAIFAGLNNPTGVAVDLGSNIFIADQRNNRIRMVSFTGIISTVAGNGTVGNGGDGGLATSAQLYYPTGIAVDIADQLYIADTNNQKIRKVFFVGGPIVTIAGNGTVGYSCTNGIATGVGLHTPTGVALDIAGNLLIADSGNQCIRKVFGSFITTVAGNGLASYSGDGGPATSAALNYPTGVAGDLSGFFYIADDVNHRIRMVTGGGISTLAGKGTPGYSGDGGPATAAQLYNPTGVAVFPPVLAVGP